MNHSFYTYALTFRGGPVSDKLAMFAEAMFYDLSFPKQSNDFEDISRYIEELAHSDMSASIFDELWLLFETNVAFQQ
ncbi:MAG: YozE family protein [Paenisporosarcina sp.]|nr:YozE family protein [Paenisporosarcina sp.]